MNKNYETKLRKICFQNYIFMRNLIKKVIKGGILLQKAVFLCHDVSKKDK